MGTGEHPYVLLSNGARLLLQSMESADAIVALLKLTTEDVLVDMDAKIDADQPHRRYVVLRAHILAVVYPPDQSATIKPGR